MVGTTLETGGKPFADEDGDISQKVRNWLDVVGSHILELFQSGREGQLELRADPFAGIADCKVVYYGDKGDVAEREPSPLTSEERARRAAVLDTLQADGQEFDAATGEGRSVVDVALEGDDPEWFVQRPAAEAGAFVERAIMDAAREMAAEAQDAPNPVASLTSADASKTGSLASPAAHEMASDVAEMDHLIKGPGLTRGRAADLPPTVWAGISGSQAVDAGRFHAVDESAPILD